MPTLSDIISDKVDRLDSVPEAFNSKVIKSQKDIFNEILSLLNQLERKNGEIVISSNNLKIIDTILDDLEQVVNQSEYVTAVAEFAKEFDKQATITKELYDKTFDQTEFNALQNAVLRAKKKESVELLLGGSLDATFYNPIRKALTDSVSSGASFKDTLQAIRDIVEGGDGKLGRLDRYSKQIAYDSFATADAAYTNAIAEDIGAEFYRYVGGVIKDSREFCKERAGKYYHYKEIEEWGTEHWDGQSLGTNPQTIFILRGGYNCQHAIIPVAISSVPDDVIERNIANGNYKK